MIYIRISYLIGGYDTYENISYCCNLYKNRRKHMIISMIGYSSETKIVDFLLDFPTNEFTKKEIMNNLGIKKQSFEKYFDCLRKSNMIISNNNKKREKTYRINFKNQQIRCIVNLENNASIQIANIAKE